MIKTRKGNVKIKGDMAEIMADFSAIVETLNKAMVKNGIPEEVALVHLDDAYRRGKMDNNELMKELLKTLVDVLEDDDKEEEGEEEHE